MLLSHVYAKGLHMRKATMYVARAYAILNPMKIQQRITNFWIGKTRIYKRMAEMRMSVLLVVHA